MLEIFKIVFFLLWINGLPPLVAILLRDRYDRAVDGGKHWIDGRPIFGPNKTLRGIIAGSAGGTLLFPLIGQAWWVAGITGLLAMIGDLLSSFIKRRSALPSGRNVVVLDQLFETLFPLMFINLFHPLTFLQNICILALSIITAYTCSRIWIHITERPIPDDYPRVVRSTVRFREWKACHRPLAQWQVWFNLTSFLSDQILLTWFFKLTGLYATGERNALNIRTEEITLSFADLPDCFDGFRLMLLVDLHLDGLPGIDRKLAMMLQEIHVDLCLIGGDIRMKTYGDSSAAITRLETVIRHIHAPFGTFGVLGNHDCIEMLPELEDSGIIMLVNDSVAIEYNGERLWILGVDDPHYYRLHDADLAAKDIPDHEFAIFLAHSPEAYKDAAGIGADLYLCGHTHGGQICLKTGTPVITNSRAPRFTATGTWEYQQMQGYTSRGVGPSSIPVRFNCAGEISLITLKKR